MKKGFLIIGKILLVLICVMFLPIFFVLCIYGGRPVSNGKPVSEPLPSPISVDKIEKMKILINASTSVEEIDEVFEKYAGIKTYEHKIEFLKKYFNCSVIDKHEDDTAEFEYNLIAT